jgi:hypothetical protein
MAADEFLAEEGARVADWLEGLLTRALCLPDGLTVDQQASQMEGARAAAAELAGGLWGEGAGIEARVQAAQFVSAHAAAMDWQAEANRRDLPPHARATAQRLARQLMALTTAQLNGLSRLRAERRKAREEAARAVARQTAAEAKARSADRRAMVADLERTLKASAQADLAAMTALVADPDADPGTLADPDPEALAELALAMAAPPPGTEAPGTAPSDPLSAPSASGAQAAYAAPLAPRSTFTPPRPAKPEPVGAGVPETTPEPAPPLNRRQRRAKERLRRRERGREKVK